MTALPSEPLELEQVLERWPTIRQSLAGQFDDCPLSMWMMLRYQNGWSTTPQARGQMFHRAAAEILRTMQRTGSTTLPRREAIEILIEVCHQRDVDPRDIVRVPLSQMPELRMAVDKLAKDNEFSVHRIVDVEKRLEATLAYPGPHGEMVRRRLTGQLDVLLHDPPDGAVVIDWKDTWALPPERADAEPTGYDDEELKGLSFHGYFQQRWYGWLVMTNFRNINRVTLREFYPRRTKVRKATLHRHQLPDVEQELGILVASMDQAFASGAPRMVRDADGFVDIDAMGWWTPQPGRHCGFCPRSTACPIPEDVRVEAGGAVTSEASAERWAARLMIADRIRHVAREGIKGWVETSGRPVPVKNAKGRMVLGWVEKRGGGRRFGVYVPDESDRGGHPDLDAQLIEAMREATARARAERGVKPRRRGTRRRVVR